MMKVNVILAAALTASLLLPSGEGGWAADKPNRHRHGGPMAAETAFSKAPLLLKAGGGRMAGTYRPANLTATILTVRGPHESGERPRSWSVPVEKKRATARPRDKIGGYHWISAREVVGDTIKTASTVRYFSMPAPAPREMLVSGHDELEIIPHPLPREHQKYRATETWPFQVRFQGRPLAGARLSYQDGSGWGEGFTTGTDGVADVTFPDPFHPEEKAAGHARRPNRSFVLSVTHRDEDYTFVTAFNYKYVPGPYHGKNLPYGLGFAVLGMGLASPLLLKRKKGGAA